MSITTVKENHEQTPGGLREDGTRECTRSFWAYSNDLNDNAYIVLAHASLPVYLSTHPNDSAAYVVDRQADRHEPLLWLVTIRYSSKLTALQAAGLGGGPDNSGGNAPGNTGGNTSPSNAAQDNPLLEPAKVVWDTEEIPAALEYDLKGVPVVSSSDEGFDPPKERPRKVLRLDITRNELSFDPTKAISYTDAVNDATWFGQPEDSVKCIRYTAQDALKNGQYYWIVHRAFLFRNLELETAICVYDPTLLGYTYTQIDRWNPTHVPDRGSYEYDDASDSYDLIRDSQGQPFASPSLLDGKGHWLNGDLSQAPADVKAIYLAFWFYKRMPFDQIFG